jgi:hypothetical protein
MATKRMVTPRLTEHLIKRIDDYAEKLGLSRNATVTILIADQLDQVDRAVADLAERTR